MVDERSHCPLRVLREITHGHVVAEEPRECGKEHRKPAEEEHRIGTPCPAKAHLDRTLRTRTRGRTISKAARTPVKAIHQHDEGHEQRQRHEGDGHDVPRRERRGIIA